MELYNFQVGGVEFLRTRPYAMLGDEMGLGKTVQAVVAARSLLGPILVICRPLNKMFWYKTIKEWDSPDVKVHIAGVAGRVNYDKLQARLRSREHSYVLIHHEALRYQPQLATIGLWECIVADESHRFKNRKARMSQYLKQIPTLRKWALSGTPMEKSPADLWSVLNWFSSRDFHSYWRWYDSFVEYYSAPFGGRVVIGPKNLEKLGAILAPIYLRRTKMEVAPDLPPKIYHNVPLQMGPQQQEVYDTALKQAFVDLKGDEMDEKFIMNALARLSLLQRLTVDPSLVGSNIEGVKTPWILDWMEDYPDEKFVVLTHIKEYATALPVLIPNSAAITGNVPIAKRIQIIEDFQAGRLRAIVGTVDTMNESINLQMAGTVIFPDLPTSSIMLTQAEDRVHRINTTRSPNIIRLLVQDSVDELALARLEKKLSDVETVQRFVKMVREKHERLP